MRVALFCGSTDVSGANRAVLVVVERLLIAQGADVVQLANVADIPIMRNELVDDAPAPVNALRTAFSEADAVVLAVPEYGGGAAGGAKNALDWMVGSGSLYERPVVVLSAGTTGGANAIEQIARTLTWQGAPVVATLGIAAPGPKRGPSGEIIEPDTVSSIERLVLQLLETVRGPDAHMHERAALTVRALGIDPVRRTSR